MKPENYKRSGNPGPIQNVNKLNIRVNFWLLRNKYFENLKIKTNSQKWSNIVFFILVLIWVLTKKFEEIRKFQYLLYKTAFIF